MPRPPSHSFTLQSNDGLLIVLKTDIWIAIAFDPVETTPTPPLKQYNAIWDTGATGSVIDQKVVVELGLKPIGITMVSHADGQCMKSVYLVNIGLPNRVGFQHMRVTEGNLGDVDVLIGMDIISQGDFAITNAKGTTTFSFRCPSLERIDFVKQASASSKIGRNAPCICGSGKKYKKCCGK